MTDPFIFPVPQKLANDPELGAYFQFLSKVLHDLTTNTGQAIANPDADVDSLKASVDSILEVLREQDLIEG